jgi:hypothetical protein
MRTTKEDFALYKRWQKYILDARPALSKGLTRPTLVAYCFAMAVHGTNGKGCFASDAAIGREIGISHRGIIGRYRVFAIDVGWFKRTGEHKGRAEVLDVSIPDTESPEVVSHDLSRAPGTCPACRRNVQRFYSGEITKAELFEVHTGVSADELCAVSVPGMFTQWDIQLFTQWGTTKIQDIYQERTNAGPGEAGPRNGC